jgi:hypothetical protein
MNTPRRIAVAASLFAILAACGGTGAGSSFGGDGGTEGASSSSGGSSSGGLVGGDASSGASCADPGAGDLAGCSCSGAPRACWTVDANKRNSNGCKDGTQTCQQSGEFSAWGPCVGEVATCAPSDAGAEGGQSTPVDCVCVPGAVRWCDSPEMCNWGQQTCLPDGNWGTCVETDKRPEGCASGGAAYDEECCLKAGQCCQDFEAWDDDQKSIGKCDNIACPGDIVR